jgi:hypothetical protein
LPASACVARPRPHVAPAPPSPSGEFPGANPRKHECVGYYVSYTKGGKGQRMATIEYFDDKGLENFFLNRPKENNGIVQKFEDPTSPYNTLLRAYWTPHKLQLQQRVNKNELGDTRVVMNDRLSTFDGPEHLNVEFEIKSYKLKSRVTDVVTAIVEHIKVLLPSAYTLWTMECFFKLSGKNKLLFLWCNDLRVFNTNGMSLIAAGRGLAHAAQPSDISVLCRSAQDRGISCAASEFTRGA